MLAQQKEIDLLKESQLQTEFDKKRFSVIVSGMKRFDEKGVEVTAETNLKTLYDKLGIKHFATKECHYFLSKPPVPASSEATSRFLVTVQTETAKKRS